MRFEPSHVEVFMGGEFDLGRPKTVAELRAVLQQMDKELEGWGDDQTITELWLDREKQVIRVDIEPGLPQP